MAQSGIARASGKRTQASAMGSTSKEVAAAPCETRKEATSSIAASPKNRFFIASISRLENS
tara:strand:- start:42 stop:224 length:183 start_codon:yes stop_codon:yes gene_type:complete